MFKDQKGQALVTLLAFVAMAIIVTAGAVAVTIINAQSTSKFSLGEEAYYITEGGIEDAILKILREPSYSGIRTVAIGNGQAVVTITPAGVGAKTVESEGINGDFRRKIRVQTGYNNGITTIISWAEVD